jgi:hypothetical protein
MESSETATAGTVTTRSSGIRFGIIAGVIGVVYFLIVNTLGGDMTQGVWRWLSYCITIAIVFFAQKYYKDNGDGFMSYGQGIGISFWTGLISGAISSVFMYIYIKFVDSGFLDMIKDKQLQQMEERGMSQDQIDQAMKFSGMFMTPEAMFIFGFIGAIVGTVIIGLIVTIFTQKKAPEQSF